MEMTDLLRKEEWAAFEKALNERALMNPCVYDTNGTSFTGFKVFANQLCPAIKSKPEGIRGICAVAHQNMAAKARDSRKPVIAECDAGLTKICVPVFVGDEFIGIVGGCGRIQPDSEVETYLIHQTTGLGLEEVERLATGVTPITLAEAEEIAADLERRVKALVDGKAVH